jgi:hypothetical protein
MSVVKVWLHVRDDFTITDGKVMYEGYVPGVFTKKGCGGGDDLLLEIDTETMKIVNFKLPRTFR